MLLARANAAAPWEATASSSCPLLSLDVRSGALVDAAHVELGRCIEPQQSSAADMDEIQSAEGRYLSLPVVFLRIDDGPVFRLFHFKVGEFSAVMGLNVLVGVAPERPVKAPDGLA